MDFIGILHFGKLWHSVVIFPARWRHCGNSESCSAAGSRQQAAVDKGFSRIFSQAVLTCESDIPKRQYGEPWETACFIFLKFSPYLFLYFAKICPVNDSCCTVWMASVDNKLTLSRLTVASVTCPTCDYTVNVLQGGRRTICPRCGNFYDPEAARNVRLRASQERSRSHERLPDIDRQVSIQCVQRCFRHWTINEEKYGCYGGFRVISETPVYAIYNMVIV